METVETVRGPQHIIYSMDHQTADYNIFVGAQGWRHVHWQHVFYPEGLPEEWRLSFYNSQFRCVYLPKSLWTSCSTTDAEAWLKDTQANFRFIFQPPDSMTQQAAAFLKAMAKRALLDHASLNDEEFLWFPPTPDLRALGRQIRQAVERGRNLYLLNREAHLPSLEKVRSLVEVMGY